MGHTGGRSSHDRAAAGHRGAPVPPGGAARLAAGAEIKRLQAAAGNRATLAMISRVQRALQVGAADDPFEREADSVARRVADALARPAASPADPSVGDAIAGAPAVRRRAQGPAAATGPAGADGGPVGAADEALLRSARSTAGSPIPGPQRERLEDAFGGADFAAVRLHTGPVAADLNERFGAKAFTVGSDIFFRDPAPSIDSRAGRELLAHELTHTIQQSGGD